MALLLALEQFQVNQETLTQPGLTGLVVTVPLGEGLLAASIEALRSARATGMELYCRILSDSLASLPVLELWQQLERIQTTLPFAKLVLPFHRQSLELVQKSARFGWHWQLDSIATIAETAQALSCGAGAIWIAVGALDEARELAGDEFCSQARTFIDDHATSAFKPLIIASDVRDQDHIERTLLYGCDRVVLNEALWHSLTR